MSRLDRSTTGWLRRHQTTITTAALAELGVSTDQRKRLVTAGVLARLVDGAYMFTGVPDSELARCAAVCTSRPALVVAGPTAGRLWAVRRSPRDGLVHVIAPPASHPCREPWVRAYRTAALDPDEVVHRPDGIRVTSPARTVVDLTRYVPDRALRSAIEDVIHRQMASAELLLETAERLSTPGRPWVRRFLGALAGRAPGGAAESDGEIELVDVLHDRGVHDLERQVWADLPGYGRVRFDAAIRSVRWVLEIDGHPDHALRDGSARDKRRDRYATAAGWHTERVASEDVRDRFRATVEQLLASIARRRADVAALQAAGRWPPPR